MNEILDSGAIIAFLRDEPGGEVVEGLLTDPRHLCWVHAVNLCEVFYDFFRAGGEADAQGAVADIFAVGVQVREDLDSDFWQSVGRLKVDPGGIALADCFCIALALRLGGEVVTADHHEFDRLAALGVVPVQFIR